jgi:glycogenin glucosyltransferase
MRPAYVSMICGGDDYLPGIETLGRSLVETGTSVPRVAMVTHDVSSAARARLEGSGWSVREVESIGNPRADRLMPRFANVFTKLRAWSLVEFDKLVFLDADTVVLRNVDDLFDRPALAAAPDFLLPDRFNSGVMVLRPSQQYLEMMLERLPELGSYDGGDQGFLNELIDWYSLPTEHRLPAAYNTHQFIFQFIAAHPLLRERLLDEVKIVHYTVQKPWRDTVLAGGSELWWRFHDRAHPDQVSRWREKLHALEDWSFGRVVSILTG